MTRTVCYFYFIFYLTQTPSVTQKTTALKENRTTYKVYFIRIKITREDLNLEKNWPHQSLHRQQLW